MVDDARAAGIHFVGTIPLEDTEEVLRTAGRLVGDRVRRLPDGETGPRKDWVWIQVPVVERHPDMEKAVVDAPGIGRLSLFRPRDGVDPATLDLGDIGYAGFARDSYATFRALRDEGAVPDGVRFQVNLPTPVAMTSVTAQFDARPAIEAAFERAVLRELAAIVGEIPHDDLAVQWDVCFELLMVEGHATAVPWFDDAWAGISDRLSRLGAAVPRDVELGLHLCYGDYQHRRSVELDDASSLVRLANTLADAIPRPLDFVHLPVREDVDAGRYLAPLDGLRLDDRTELYLGLITDRDAAADALTRIEQARRHVGEFGVATECGMGRTPVDTVRTLLDVHREISRPVAARAGR